MAVFSITPTTSIITSDPDDNAFDTDSPGADSLTINAGAFLITTGFTSRGAWLKNMGAWTLTVNGSILAEQYSGIALDPGNTAVSTITVGADGQVGGDTGMTIGSAANIKNAGIIEGTDFEAIFLHGPGTTTITNSGRIIGQSFSILDSVGLSNDKVTNSGTLDGSVNLSFGNDTLTNSGTVKGNVFLGEGVNTLTNSGTISANVFGGDGIDTVFNSKTINGNVDLAGAANKVTNSGTIDSVFGGSGDDTVTNSGTIISNVQLFGGVNKLTNSGTIFQVFGGIGSDTITNSKTITTSVFLDDGVNKLTNSGTIGDSVDGGADADTVMNSKTITGNVTLFGGNDVFTNTGNVGGFINLGDGDDKFTGGAFADRLGDSDGSDTIKLGGGNEIYNAIGPGVGLDGTDIVDGGAGFDTYSALAASAAFGSIHINLDTIAHDFSPIGAPGAGAVAAKTATGDMVAGGLKDTITGFENAIGGFAGDIIYGSGAVNTLIGDRGADFLFGFGGNDTLEGGDGADNLVGGAGRDTLIGGLDGDTFWYGAISESGATAASRDLIVLFLAGAGGDVIDLSRIDANTKNGAAMNDSFVFAGTNITTGFSGAAGELHAYWTVTGQIIEGDVNGDKKADFSIEIVDPAHAITLSVTDGVDFVL